ncbi:hypothetical protein Esti_003909 [Eimeria stiedai]
MAASSPTYDVHLLEAAWAWTDAQYFRLLSRELPVDSKSNKPSRRASIESLDDRCGAMPSAPKLSPVASPHVFAEAALRAAHAELEACSASRGTSPSTFSSSSSPSPGGWSSPDAAKKASAGTQQQQEQQEQEGVLKIEAEDSPGCVGGQTAPADLPPHNLTSRWRAFWRQLSVEEREAASSNSSSSRSSPKVPPCRKAEQEEPSCLTAAAARVLFQACGSIEIAGSSGVGGKTAASTEVIEEPPPAAPARQKRLYNSSAGVDSEAEKLRQLPKVTGVRFQAQRNRFVAEWYDHGKTRMAYFPVKQHGFEGARRLAIECRERVLLSKSQRLSCGSRTHGAAKRACDPVVQEATAGSPKLIQNLQPSEEVGSLLKRHCPERVSEVSCFRSSSFPKASLILFMPLVLEEGVLQCLLLGPAMPLTIGLILAKKPVTGKVRKKEGRARKQFECCCWLSELFTAQAGEAPQAVGGESPPSPPPSLRAGGVSELGKGENSSSLQERLFLVQAALNVILIDLLSKCLSCGSGKEAKDARKLVERLHRQLQYIYTARDFAQPRQSLWLTEATVTNSSGLTSSRTKAEAQPRTLLDLFEVAAPRG